MMLLMLMMLVWRVSLVKGLAADAHDARLVVLSLWLRALAADAHDARLMVLPRWRSLVEGLGG